MHLIQAGESYRPRHLGYGVSVRNKSHRNADGTWDTANLCYAFLINKAFHML
jgi:hypothetical protein